MIFKFNSTSKEIELCSRTNFSSHKILERQHIEKWIENNSEILGEELLILTNEYDQFDKTSERLDLLALDRDGNIVIIELKRDDSGKNADLQAVKYAAYCSTFTIVDVIDIYRNYLLRYGTKPSIEEVREKIMNYITNSDFQEINDKPRIILVSKEFRPEVTASILWLRNFGLDIRCIKLTPYEAGNDSIIIEVNTIIPLPDAGDYTIRAEQKEKSEGKISAYRQEYLDFFTDISERLSGKVSSNLSTPLAQSYYQIYTGISSVHFEWGFHGRPRNSFGVELHFERGDIDFNKKLLNKLSVRKDALEKATGEKLIIQESWGHKWSRLYFEYQSGVIDEELKVWAVEKMEVLIKVLQPEIDQL